VGYAMTHQALGLPSRHPVVRTVERALTGLGRKLEREFVVVAVSGGADSTFLIHAIYALRRRFGYRMAIAHVDHGWRGEASREDARSVGRIGIRLGVPVHAMSASGTHDARPRGGIEASARQIRYQFLAGVAHALDAVAVLVAHTADDQAETLILSLLRGRSIAGLAGMAEASTLPVTEAPRAVLFRPLLGITGAVVRDTLRKNGIAWRNDESNEDRARARNRLRHDVMPALEAISPGFRSALARSSRDVEAVRDMLDSAVRHASARWNAEQTGWSVKRTDWMTDPSVVRLGALREMMMRIGVPAGQIESSHLTEIARMVAMNRGGARRTTGQCVVELIGGRIRVLAPSDA
jgi:tRNA(Ile)-lysidine synthase